LSASDDEVFAPAILRIRGVHRGNAPGQVLGSAGTAAGMLVIAGHGIRSTGVWIVCALSLWIQQ